MQHLEKLTEFSGILMTSIFLMKSDVSSIKDRISHKKGCKMLSMYCDVGSCRDPCAAIIGRPTRGKPSLCIYGKILKIGTLGCSLIKNSLKSLSM